MTSPAQCLHNDPRFWCEEKTDRGVRVSCNVCRRFIGYKRAADAPAAEKMFARGKPAADPSSG